uniref:Uncharacterized protein n=1 Tax=Rhizophora mucronata TaxID=61149 RepID=A0A2P2PA37_RHIMU
MTLSMREKVFLPKLHLMFPNVQLVLILACSGELMSQMVLMK